MKIRSGGHLRPAERGESEPAFKKCRRTQISDRLHKKSTETDACEETQHLLDQHLLDKPCRCLGRPHIPHPYNNFSNIAPLSI